MEAVSTASNGLMSLGRRLGGGGRGCLLLGRGLHQCQPLGQAAAGFHYHIVFNLLPDPDLQVLLELLLLHDARLLRGDYTTTLPRAPVALGGRCSCFALRRLPCLELALSLRHDSGCAGKGGTVRNRTRNAQGTMGYSGDAGRKGSRDTTWQSITGVKHP